MLLDAALKKFKASDVPGHDKVITFDAENKKSPVHVRLEFKSEKAAANVRNPIFGFKRKNA